MHIESFSVAMIIGTCMHVLQLAPNLHDTFVVFNVYFMAVVTVGLYSYYLLICYYQAEQVAKAKFKHCCYL